MVGVLVLGVAYSPDGKYIATGSVDHTAKIWDAETGKALYTLSDADRPIVSLDFAPDSARMVTASGANPDDESLSTVGIWDAANGQQLLAISGRFSGDVSFNPDGKTFATGMRNGTIKIWDAATGQETLTLTSNISFAQPLAYSPDGKLLAAGGDDGVARIWDAGTGQLVLTLNGSAGISGITFSHDGKLIATSGDATVKVWDAVTGQQLFVLTSHTGGTFGVAFSPDDQYLASTSVDRTVKIWNVADNFTSQPLTLYGHTKAVYRVVFSPDGSRIVTASRDGTARIYAFSIDDLVSIAESRLTRSLTLQECQQYCTWRSVRGIDPLRH